jgi:small subunit ribosomal protein S8
MSIQDPISDLLTRIRNGHSASKKTITCPSSKMKTDLLKILKDQGYIQSYSVEEYDNVKKRVHIHLKYHRREPVITEIKRVSKCSCRIYSGSQKLPVVLNGLGIAIMTTSQGLMTSAEAAKRGIGGEVICTVY